MSIELYFYEHPVFRLDEFIQWKQQASNANLRATHAQLQHYLKAGRLLRIRRELYAVIPPNQSRESLTVDPYLIAGKVAPDSVIAFHSALELFGVAYSAFDQITYLSCHKTKPFEFQERWFQPVALPSKLKNKKDAFFEVETINRQGINIRICSLGRTYVDVLNRVDLSGGWEEVIRSISNISVMNIERVIEYCCKLDNAILSAKVGYFIEQRQGAFAATKEQIDTLLLQKPSSPQYLSKKNRESCRLIKKWNIMLPLKVINHAWEEPNYDV